MASDKVVERSLQSSLWKRAGKLLLRKFFVANFHRSSVVWVKGCWRRRRSKGKRKLFSQNLSAITALNKLFPIRRIKTEWNSFSFLLLHLGTNMLDSSNYCITQFLHQSCLHSARVARREKKKKLKQLLFIVKEAQVCALFLGCCISP